MVSPNFEPEPVLCTEAEPSVDGRIWKLKLRQDAAFSNGAAMTAADVVYSFELAIKSELYGDRLRAIDNVVQSGRYEVTVSLSKPMGSLPLLLDFPIIGYGSAADPIGTGPYVLRRDQGRAVSRGYR